LLLDKPRGLSSNVALQKARHLFRAEKAGHTGTLDPEATGLLPLCFGEATKFSSYLLDAPKGYEATLCLGETSDTGDAEGQLTPGHGPIPSSCAVIEETLRSLLGQQEQIPPMHSALKHEGKPLYDYARAGIEIARPARQICIFKLELLGLEGRFLRVQADCSKGTYIRVLAEEIGRRLGCGAWLSSLRRNRTGGFVLEDALTLEAIAALDDSQRALLLMSPETLVHEVPRLDIGINEAQALRHGQSPVLLAPIPSMLIDQTVRVYWPDGLFLGLAKPQANGQLVAVRLMSESPHI
jgi:tRNA pseudouridine55 synthase